MTSRGIKTVVLVLTSNTGKPLSISLGLRPCSITQLQNVRSTLSRRPTSLSNFSAAWLCRYQGFGRTGIPEFFWILICGSRNILSIKVGNPCDETRFHHVSSLYGHGTLLHTHLLIMKPFVICRTSWAHYLIPVPLSTKQQIQKT